MNCSERGVEGFGSQASDSESSVAFQYFLLRDSFFLEEYHKIEFQSKMKLDIPR